MMYKLNDFDSEAEVLNKLNEVSEELEKEKDKYSQLFEKYWDMKKKLNQISNVIYRYDHKVNERDENG